MEIQAVLRKLDRDAEALTALSKQCVSLGATAPASQETPWYYLLAPLSEAMAETILMRFRLEKAVAAGRLPPTAEFTLPSLPPLPPTGLGKKKNQFFCETTSGTISGNTKSLGEKRRPRLKPKPKGGAPLGNINAMKSGAYRRSRRDFHVALMSYARTLQGNLSPLLPPKGAS